MNSTGLNRACAASSFKAVGPCWLSLGMTFEQILVGTSDWLRQKLMAHVFPGCGRVYASLMSWNKSEAPVRCFPSIRLTE